MSDEAPPSGPPPPAQPPAWDPNLAHWRATHQQAPPPPQLTADEIQVRAMLLRTIPLQSHSKSEFSVVNPRPLRPDAQRRVDALAALEKHLFEREMLEQTRALLRNTWRYRLALWLARRLVPGWPR